MKRLCLCVSLLNSSLEESPGISEKMRAAIGDEQQQTPLNLLRSHQGND